MKCVFRHIYKITKSRFCIFALLFSFALTGNVFAQNAEEQTPEIDTLSYIDQQAELFNIQTDIEKYLVYVNKISSRLSYVNEKNITKAQKSITILDRKWGNYSEKIAEKISEDNYLIGLTVDVETKIKHIKDSLEIRIDVVKSKPIFNDAMISILGQTKYYNSTLKKAKSYALVKTFSKKLEELKASEQIVFTDIQAKWELAKSIESKYPNEFGNQLKELEPKFVEIQTLSEEIQVQEYKTFFARIKEYLYGLAAVGIILMFLNMVQTKISYIKQMRKSANEMKKMMGGEHNYPTI